MDNRYGAGLLAGLLLAAAIGCAHDEPRVHYLGDSDLEYYKEAATQVDYPLVIHETPDTVLISDAPRTLHEPRKDQIWDMTLMEAIQIALANNPVVRTAPAFELGSSPLFNNPDFIPSVFDPAIQETGVLFGGRGVEAALAAFDPTLAGQMTWGRDERIQNSFLFGNTFGLFGAGFPGGGFGGVGFPGGGAGGGGAGGGGAGGGGAGGVGGIGGGGAQGAVGGPASELVAETANFEANLQKIFAYGGQVTLTHSWLYNGTNTPNVLFPSSYIGLMQLGYRHPLLAGSGTDFTRVAGPIANAFGGITGVNQGVVIARINNDIEIADFEAAVRNLTRDVERLYWDLYLQYRLYDVAIVARNSALRNWQITKDIVETGGLAARQEQQGDPIANEALARAQYFEAKELASTALSVLYTTETQLRQLLGLPVNEGKIIRPTDEPPLAELVPDWHASLAEALTNRVELRRQKFSVKSLELQLQAAQNLVRPRLDFVGNYHVNAFGDRLFGEQDDDGLTAQGLRSGYETLTQGDQTGWAAGFEFNMPIGLRSARTQVRNIELRLAKSRSVLATQEQDVAHEVAVSMQNMARFHRAAELNFNRRVAAAERVEQITERFEAGDERLEFLLQAIRDRALADQAYFTSLADYARAIADYHFAKGNLLEYNNVYLAEGGWHPAAYQQALRRAWHRSYAFEHNCTDAEPDVFAAPENQHDGDYAPAHPPVPPQEPHPATDAPPPGPGLVPAPVPEVQEPDAPAPRQPEPSPRSPYEPRSPYDEPMTDAAEPPRLDARGAASPTIPMTAPAASRLELPPISGGEPAGKESLELLPGRDYLE